MNEPPLTLEPGDRVPNFTLPNHEGTGLMFYNKTRGGPIALFVYARNADAAAGREIAALAAHRPALDELGAEIFVINRDSAGNNAALVAAHGLGGHVLSDPMGRITGAFAAAVTPGWAEETASTLPVFCLALDPNQRILEVIHAGDRPLAERVVEALRRGLPAPEARDLTTAAPVLMLPNMLDPATCRRLVEVWETGGHEEGNVFAVKGGKPVSYVDLARKKRLDHAVRDPALTGELMRTLGPRLVAEVFKAYAYGDFVLEPFTIGAYDVSRGDYFRAHRDNTGPATAARRFALSLNLNEDYEGGGLVFPEYGPHLYMPCAGMAVIFSCSLLHEALPVTAGRRYVLLSFLRDSRNRPHPWSMGAG
ncbi:MAG: redoxin domain-containing protein [Alphaproteobacteria bacterium]